MGGLYRGSEHRRRRVAAQQNSGTAGRSNMWAVSIHRGASYGGFAAGYLEGGTVCD